jgi:hypothetical protein
MRKTKKKKRKKKRKEKSALTAQQPQLGEKWSCCWGNFEEDIVGDT